MAKSLGVKLQGFGSKVMHGQQRRYLFAVRRVVMQSVSDMFAADGKRFGGKHWTATMLANVAA